MIGHAALCQLRNAITAETWTVVNQLFAEAGVENGKITGEKLRLDRTAVETNTHYPTDSSLLWDCYRAHARLIREIREMAPMAVGDKRVKHRGA